MAASIAFPPSRGWCARHVPFTISHRTSGNTTVKALVISDQPLTVIALQSVLRRADPEADLLDATHLGEALRTLHDQGPFDFIVLDLDTHGVRRVSGAALLRQMWPGVPLALSSETQQARSE